MQKEEFDMIAERNPVIKKAVVRLTELSQDEKTRMMYESRQKLEWDMWSREQEGVFRVAKNLLNKNMSVEDVIEVTGLTYEDIEEIQADGF